MEDAKKSVGCILDGDQNQLFTCEVLGVALNSKGINGLTLCMFKIWKCRNYKILREENIQEITVTNTIIWNIRMKLGAYLSKCTANEDI
ncbi:hypothetical protein QQ045_014833 [Rhodiola kirilowii]